MCLRECWCTNKAGSFFCIIGHFPDLKCLSVHLFFCLLSVHTERLTVGMLYTETIMNPWYLTRPVFGIIVSHSFYVSHEWVRNSNQYYWYTYDYSNDWSRSVEDASLILKCKFRKSVYEPRMKACTVYHKKRWFYLYEIFQVFSICKDFLNFNCLHLWTEKWMVAAGLCLQVCGYVAFRDRWTTRPFIQWHWGWQYPRKGFPSRPSDSSFIEAVMGTSVCLCAL